MKKTLVLPLMFGIVAVVAAFTSSLPKQERKITITLSEQEWNTVLQGLGKLPLENSQQVYMSIMQQAQSQLQPAQQLPQKKDTTNKKKS